MQVNLLWIPYIIFRNTDSDEAVTLGGELRTLVAVTREGGFVRSGPEVADEVSCCLLHCIILYTVHNITDGDFQRRRKYDHNEPNA